MAGGAGAGGDRAALERKAALREKVWAALDEAGVSRFPGAQGRIPNFAGAADAAERLRGTGPWHSAAAVKANPDSPQWPVRQRAVADGKRLYMAVPRLAEPDPFILVDPDRLAVPPRAATSIRGAGEHGVPVPVADLEPVALVVVGCVAVGRDGARLGKGGGFADLEFAVAAEAGLIDDATVVATTVHPVQVVHRGRIPVTGHDVPVDLIVTPDEVIPCDPAPRPSGIHWHELTDEKVDAIPFLAGR